MTLEEVKEELESIPSTLNGDITDAQAGLIAFLTRDAGFTCNFDDNPIIYAWKGDERVTELSKADAARFITMFGEKDEEGWKPKNIAKMSTLHNEFMRLSGQERLF